MTEPLDTFTRVKALEFYANLSRRDPYTAMLYDFHHTFNAYIGPRYDNQPAIPNDATLRQLRIDLVAEELQEFRDATDELNLVEIADALGDLLYVVVGAAINYGIPLLEVVREIHRSNMSKLGPDGTPLLRADGKILKGPNYTPPNLLPILFPEGRVPDRYLTT